MKKNEGSVPEFRSTPPVYGASSYNNHARALLVKICMYVPFAKRQNR